MAVSQCKCPLCASISHASDIDHGNRARVYCPNCSAYDITKLALKRLVNSSLTLCQSLGRQAKAAPGGKILDITGDGAAYEDKQPKPDRPAPAWLTAI
jgi:hypothetical protein